MKITLVAALCFCLGLAGFTLGSKPSGEFHVGVNQLVPDKAPTQEEVAGHMGEMCAAVQDSLARLKELAANSTDKKAVRAAEKAIQEHEARLEELAALDYSAMTVEEISEYMIELSGIGTAFREVRDLLNGLG